MLASFVVDTGGDAGDGTCNVGGCTLRDAVLAANASAGADTISFDPSVTGTITLTPAGGTLTVTEALTVEGPGAAALTIQANASEANQFRIFDITDTATNVTFEGLTLTGGHITTVTEPAGGAIRFDSEGTLTVRDSIVTGNTASNGGGIYSVDGTVNIESSTVSSNTAEAGDGGGIQNVNGDTTLTSSFVNNNDSFNSGAGLFSPYLGTITITDTEITGNRITYDGYNGAGIYSGEGNVTITGSTISGNTTTTDGGGLYNIGGDVSINRSTISNNTATYAGGGIFNYTGTLSITATQITDNMTQNGDGGGISNDQSTLTLTRSTISGNRSEQDGGGLSSGSGRVIVVDSLIADNTGANGGAIATITGAVTVTNSTISGNAANVNGGGIRSESAAVRVVNSTITDNTAGSAGTGGGISVNANDDGESILIQNSIVAGNTASAGGNDLVDPFDPVANRTVQSSVIGNNDATTLAAASPDANGNFIGSAVSPIDPLLQPLAENGGSTRTHAVSFGSVAIDAGDNSLALDFGPDGAPGGGDDVALVGDQRGGLFGRFVNSGIGSLTTDIGAFEVQPQPILEVDSGGDVVNGDLSPGDRTLREMIQFANESAGADTILFQGGLTTITLDPALGPLEITESVRIEGLGANVLTIQKNAADPGRLINVTSTAGDVTIRGLTLTGGNAGNEHGGAILSDSTGTLLLVQTALHNNSAASGGAVAASAGALAVATSTLNDNTATGDGGAIVALNGAASVTIVDSTISTNTASVVGGGVYSVNAPVTVDSSTITLNTASSGGGVGLLANGNGEALTVVNSIIAQNTGGGAPDFVAPQNANDLDVDASLIGDNAGTGLTESQLNAGVPQPDASGNLIGGGANPAIDPMLAPLALAGGPTMTHVPLADSLVIDAGNINLRPQDVFDVNGNGNSSERLPIDQRGAARATGQVDMGAVELAPAATVTWNDPADIVFGTALGLAQLNATANTFGTFEYTPGTGTELSAGAGQQLSVLFTPSNQLLFGPATATVSINVLKADPVITWQDPFDIVFGTALSATQLNATADVTGTFSYDPDFDAELNAGTHTLSTTFTPQDSDNYNEVSANVSLTVLKADPVITWEDPDPIVAGTPLSATELDATANIEGVFVYDPIEGTVLNPGPNQQLSVTFNPTDSNNYNSAQANVLIDVTQMLDFGDAPAGYPVTAADDGARHQPGTLTLGATIDAESDGQPSADADGDGDDEDGLTEVADAVAINGASTTSSFLVTVSEAGLLDAWIDFDSNQSWEPSEQIAASLSVTPGANLISYTVPDGAIAGQTVARLRLSTAGGLSPTGEAADGEVEDHVVNLLDGGASPAVSINVPNGTAVVQVTGGNLVISDGQTDLFSAPAASLGTTSVLGSDADDNVTLDFIDAPEGGLTVDGGAGANSLAITTPSLDLTGSGPIDVSNFAQIDASDASLNTITINAAAVSALSPNNNTIRVIGSEPLSEAEADQLVFADADDWRMGSPFVDNGRFIRIATNQQTGEVVEIDMANGWQNPVEPSDVDGLGTVTAGDALRIINELGRRAFSDRTTQEMNDPVGVDPFPGLYYDQNADGKATALDALRVINRLTVINNSGGNGEGELVSPAAQQSLADLRERMELEETLESTELDRKLKDDPGFEAAASVQQSSLPQDSDDEREEWASRVDQMLSDAGWLEN